MDRPLPPCKNCANHNARCKFECERWHRYEKEKAEFDVAYRKFTKNENDIQSVTITRANEAKKRFFKK